MSLDLQSAIAAFELFFLSSDQRLFQIFHLLKTTGFISDQDQRFFDRYPNDIRAHVRLLERLKQAPSIHIVLPTLDNLDRARLASILYSNLPLSTLPSNPPSNLLSDIPKRSRFFDGPPPSPTLPTKKPRPSLNPPGDQSSSQSLYSAPQQHQLNSQVLPSLNHQIQLPLHLAHPQQSFSPQVSLTPSASLSHTHTPTPLPFELATKRASPTVELAGSSQGHQDSEPTSGSTSSTPSTTPNTTSHSNSNTVSAPRRRELATAAQKSEILRWHGEHGENQSQTARHFEDIYPSLKLSQPLISSWLKSVPGPCHPTPAPTEPRAGPSCRRRQQKTKHVQVTEALERWCAEAVAAGVELNGDVIREKWRAFATALGVPQASWLKLSEGWLSSFKDRNGLKGFKRHGHRNSGRAQLANRALLGSSPLASSGTGPIRASSILNHSGPGLMRPSSSLGTAQSRSQQQLLAQQPVGQPPQSSGSSSAESLSLRPSTAGSFVGGVCQVGQVEHCQEQQRNAQQQQPEYQPHYQQQLQQHVWDTWGKLSRVPDPSSSRNEVHQQASSFDSTRSSKTIVEPNHHDHHQDSSCQHDDDDDDQQDKQNHHEQLSGQEQEGTSEGGRRRENKSNGEKSLMSCQFDEKDCDGGNCGNDDGRDGKCGNGGRDDGGVNGGGRSNDGGGD